MQTGLEKHRAEIMSQWRRRTGDNIIYRIVYKEQ